MAIGAPLARVHRALGRRPPAGPNEPITPTGASNEFHGPPIIDVQAPYGVAPRRELTLRYEDVAFYLLAGRVAAFMVTSPGARTRRGVAVGTPLDRVSQLYGNLRCATANVDRERERFRACTGRIARRRYIWFGGDPVRNITIGPRPFVF